MQKADDDLKKSGMKVAQAMEKFRQLVIRAKNVGRDTINKTLVQLLHGVATCFNSAFEQVSIISVPLSLV